MSTAAVELPSAAPMPSMGKGTQDGFEAGLECPTTPERQQHDFDHVSSTVLGLTHVHLHRHLGKESS